MKPEKGKHRLPVRWVVPLLLCAPIATYSQAVAYFGNESFHLLAAQLINAGKKPYLDFFYQHPPLFAYLTAGWMRVFGENWRSAHLFSAILTVSCIILVADYLYTRLSETRVMISAAAVALLGLNFYVICFGAVGLPFGLCLLLTFASFRLTVESVHKRGIWLPFLAGLAAGASAASSLLTAPVLLVLPAWLARYDQTGSRLKKCLGFAIGGLIPFIPLLWLSVLAPRQVFFNIVEYHLFHRVGSEGNMIRWNLREILEWFGSIQGIVLTGLAAIGLTFTFRHRGPELRTRGELYLCGWLILVLSVYLATPRPTFAFYFVIVTPFAAVLAARGLAVAADFRWLSTRRGLLITTLVVLYSIGLGWQVFRMRREIFQADHKLIATIAREIDQVTGPDDWVFAFEQVYFEARRMPPPGMENGFNPYSRRDEWLAANRFATVCMMANDPRIASLNLFERYAGHKAFTTPNFTVYLFWDLIALPNQPPGTPIR